MGRNYAYELIKANDALRPEQIAGATNGIVIDRLRYDSAILGASLGDDDATNISSAVFKIQHGEESDGSDMADVSAALLPQGVDVTVATGDAFGILGMDLKGLHRYIRVVGTPTLAGGATYIEAAAQIYLGDPEDQPVSYA